MNFHVQAFEYLNMRCVVLGALGWMRMSYVLFPRMTGVQMIPVLQCSSAHVRLIVVGSMMTALHLSRHMCFLLAVQLFGPQAGL